jgi:hypothetical protein
MLLVAYGEVCAQWTNTTNIQNTNSGTVSIGTGVTATDKLEVGAGSGLVGRRVFFHTTIPGVTPGGLISFSRAGDGIKALYLGTSAAPALDAVLFNSGGGTEMRFVAGGGSSLGFGFYSNMPVADAFAGTMTATPIFKITGAGNVGIGTIPTEAKLHVMGNITAEGDGAGQYKSIDLKNGAHRWHISGPRYGENNRLAIFYNTGGNYSDYLSVSTGGNVGIGAFPVDPTAKLHVKGDIFVDTYKMQFYSTGGGDRNYIQSASGTWNFKSIYDDIVLDAGIGTSNNSFKTIFKSGGVETMRIENSGNVGIGLNGQSPTTKLHVKGDVYLETYQLQFYSTNGGKNYVQAGSGEWKFKSNYDNIVFDAGEGTPQNDFRVIFRTGGDETMRIDNNGNVGIGTGENPDAKLAVKGVIHTQEVRVDLGGSMAPDYVFEPSYQLVSLSETEQYIKANKHLPEIPAAAEMEKEGLHLKEMNLLLLKKVEELTLHLIDQNKKLEAEQITNQVQAEEIRNLKSAIQHIRNKTDK